MTHQDHFDHVKCGGGEGGGGVRRGGRDHLGNLPAGQLLAPAGQLQAEYCFLTLLSNHYSVQHSHGFSFVLLYSMKNLK